MSIPAAYREALRKTEGAPFLTLDQDCLKLYPFEDWCEYEQKILANSDVDPSAQDYVRFVVSNAAETPIDKQGRILVPQYLREAVALEKDVTLAGVGPTIELWDPARLSVHDAQTRTNFRQISHDFAEKMRS